MTCANCGAEVAPHESFCEACGQTLTPTAAVAETPTDESPITLSRSVRGALVTDDEAVVVAPRACANCGGEVGEDGYCTTCGTKAPRERDHYTERPSDWVAASCDRGVRHHRNEDASAVASDPDPGSRAVLVVCDGVSSSVDSDVASLAAARAARDVLVAHQAAGLGVPASLASALAKGIENAAALANAAVIDATAQGEDASHDNAASCTFSAAVIHQDLIVHGNIGDSRSYWIPDPGQSEEPRALSLDDSVAQEQISAGASREEAEAGPHAHAITKWLGVDSPDFVPSTGSISVRCDGWLLVCSDGLWNYVSEAADLQTLIAELTANQSSGRPDPLTLAEALVKWACDQGGKDNVTVALARHTGREVRLAPLTDSLPEDHSPSSDTPGGGS